MADDNVTKVVLDLDNTGFLEKMAESLGVMEKLGVEGASALGGITESLTLLVGVVAPVTVALLAVKTALDLTVESEHIQQVNNSFNMLAKSAGLAGEALKEDLIKASGGLVGETDLLQAANRAIVEMGGNANKLPQIMEIARKATVLFGGDLTTNFENINRALANGNERMLRQYGIVVDSTKAHADYAKQLGVGVEFLSVAGQKQSIFNAALEQAQAKFKDVDTSSMQVTTNLQKLSASWANLKEAIAGVFGYIESKLHVFSFLTDQLNTITNFWAKTVKNNLTGANKESKEHQENLKKQIELQKEAAKSAGGSGPDMVNQEKLKQAKLKFEGDILKIKQDSEKSQEAVETSLANFIKIRDNEIFTAAQEANEKIRNLEVNGLQKGLITREQYAQAVINIQKKLDADVTKIRLKAENDEITALKNLADQNDKTAKGFGAEWAKNGAEARKSLNSMKTAADVTFGAVKNQAVTAFKAMGDGSKNGADAMKGFVLGALGDVATQYGEFHLANGIASYNFVEVAEGGALIALGAALSSAGSGSGSSAASSSGGGGGGGGGSSSALGIGNTAPGATAPAPVAAQQKHLTVAIQGNIFETDQTRTRLMDMIRQAGDFTDFNLKQIGQA